MDIGASSRFRCVVVETFERLTGKESHGRFYALHARIYQTVLLGPTNLGQSSSELQRNHKAMDVLVLFVVIFVNEEA